LVEDRPRLQAPGRSKRIILQTRVREETMDIQFAGVELTEIRDAVREHLETLPRQIDSFLEDHIVGSAHYHIVIDGARAGFASIHKGALITQFSLAEPYQRYGQSVYTRLRKMETVREAFVPTCDEFFLSHALDDYRQLSKQAYFFTARGEAVSPDVSAGYALRPAEPRDSERIREFSGDFLEDVARHVQAGEVFLTHRNEDLVGLGLIVPSKLYRDVASIGMFTIEAFRGAGVGTATIALLIAECRRHGIRPVAGCWYYNHLSKKTLERAGMVTRTRLLRIEY
jgi:GNAT superfamily N-acetyltransferase